MQTKNVILGLSACLSAACSTDTRKAEQREAESPAAHEAAESYILTSIRSGNPDDEFNFSGKHAREIANRLLPPWSDNVVRAMMYEGALPGGRGSNVLVRFTLKPTLIDGSLCETTIIDLEYRRVPSSRQGALIERLIVEGKIPGQEPTVREMQRTIRLPKAPSAEAATPQQCESLTPTALRWPIEGSAFHAQQLAQQLDRWISLLMKDLPAGRVDVVCIDSANKPCNLSLPVVLDMIRVNPPQRRASVSLPGRESWTTFDFIQSKGELTTGYSIAISRSEKGTAAIRIKLIEQPVVKVMH